MALFTTIPVVVVAGRRPKPTLPASVSIVLAATKPYTRLSATTASTAVAIDC